jgi:hypothetical protein
MPEPTKRLPPDRWRPLSAFRRLPAHLPRDGGAPEKIHGPRGRPLLVDTGDAEVDRDLSGYVRVITGYNEHIIYRVST